MSSYPVLPFTSLVREFTETIELPFGAVAWVLPGMVIGIFLAVLLLSLALSRVHGAGGSE